MATRSLKREWELQDRAIAGLPKGYNYPLFSARQAIESQRRSAYRTTGSAALEIVDNAMEAGADKIHVTFDRVERVRQGKKGQSVSHVAFIDNGAGMRPEMIRFALSWGGGTRADHPDFLGRFGFGLPNSSINQTRLVRVFSRRAAEDDWMEGVLDIDAVSADGRVTIPKPKAGELPAFVCAYLDRAGFELSHGTVIVWTNPDRLTYRRVATLKEHLIDHFGVVYRYLLDDVELMVEGVSVAPVDPLFLMPNARHFLATDDGGAEQKERRVLPVVLRADSETGEKRLDKLEEGEEIPSADDPEVAAVGAITVKTSWLPLGFAVGRATKGVKPLDEHSNARFDVRAPRRGVSFVRAGREIETADNFPRSQKDVNSGLGKWPLLQSYAYHWGVEVSFTPELDEVFGITNDKQGVRPIEDFWRVLAAEEIDKHCNWLNEEQKRLRKKAAKDAKEPVSSESPSRAEQAAASADAARGRRPEVPDHEKEQADQRRAAAAEERASVSNESVEQAREAIESEARRRPYRVDFEKVPTGPLYRPEWVNGIQVVVWVNRAHPFYSVLYHPLAALPDGGRAREAVDALLLCLARAELTSENPQTRLFYETQREAVWSPDVMRVMRALEGMRSGAGDEEEDDESLHPPDEAEVS